MTADPDRAALVEKMARDIRQSISKITVNNPSYISAQQETLNNTLDYRLLDEIASIAATTALAAYEAHRQNSKGESKK